MKLKDISVDYKKTLRNSISQIKSLRSIQDSRIQGMANIFSPELIAEQFPDYWKKAQGGALSGLAPVTQRGSAVNPSYTKTSGGGSGSSSSTPKAGELDPTKVDQALKDKGINVEETFNQLKTGPIQANSKSADFINKMSPEQRQATGINATDVYDAQGRHHKGYELAPTEASKLSDSEVIAKSGSQFTNKENAVISMITSTSREGSSNPDVIFGDSKGKPGTGKYDYLLGGKRLSDMTINEVRDLQKNMIHATAAAGIGGGRGTSAVGIPQMISTTLVGNLNKLGIPEKDWGTVKLDENLQKRLLLQNFKDNVGDPNKDSSTWNKAGLMNQWESFDTRKGFRDFSSDLAQIDSTKNDANIDMKNVTPEKIAAARKLLEDQEMAGRISATKKAAYETQLGDGKIPPDLVSGPSGKITNPQMALELAKQDLGENEIADRQKLTKYFNDHGFKVDPAVTAWCATYVNSKLKDAGIKGTGSEAAGSFSKWGASVGDPSKIMAGDIAVVRGISPRTGLDGKHVAFATGQTKVGPNGELMVEILGGNQGKVGAVSKEWYPASALNIRRATKDELPQEVPQGTTPKSVESPKSQTVTSPITTQKPQLVTDTMKTVEHDSRNAGVAGKQLDQPVIDKTKGYDDSTKRYWQDNLPKSNIDPLNPVNNKGNASEPDSIVKQLYSQKANEAANWIDDPDLKNYMKDRPDLQQKVATTSINNEFPVAPSEWNPGKDIKNRGASVPTYDDSAANLRPVPIPQMQQPNPMDTIQNLQEPKGPDNKSSPQLGPEAPQLQSSGAMQQTTPPPQIQKPQTDNSGVLGSSFGNVPSAPSADRAYNKDASDHGMPITL